MRRAFAAALVLGPLAALAAFAGGFSAPSSHIASTAASDGARPCDSHCRRDWMDANLRLNQLQFVGTPSSYKQKPSPGVLTIIRMGGRAGEEALDFGEPPLTQQLDAGVRALGFDIVNDPRGGAYAHPAIAGMAMDLLPDNYLAAMKQPGFKTIHVTDVDYRSSCPALKDCLAEVAAWSKAHPGHLPLIITLRPNTTKTPMPGALTPVAFDAAALEALDREVRAVFPPGAIFTPDALQGPHASLREAVTNGGWPKLGAVRGKVILVLDGGEALARLYQGGRKSLEGRAMFVAVNQDSPLASFLSFADPRSDGARIAAAVKAGFVVSTLADAETREARIFHRHRRDAAFASGAQIVESDFALPDPAIGPYQVSLKDNPAALCGAALAPEPCVRFTATGTTLTASLP
ncbi:MAG: hypothetical protein JO256_14975 [Alphaproteobacteria bacterium]|nr:hypothetical protein [Alphaproteobacteria bacterium]